MLGLGFPKLSLIFSSSSIEGVTDLLALMAGASKNGGNGRKLFKVHCQNAIDWSWISKQNFISSNIKEVTDLLILTLGVAKNGRKGKIHSKFKARMPMIGLGFPKLSLNGF